MSPFEAIMLICFGAAWPLSIWKSISSKSTKGKSLLFMVVIFVGYLSGTVHKIFFSFDLIIILYIFNAVMVFTDLMLYFRNRKAELDSEKSQAEI